MVVAKLIKSQLKMVMRGRQWMTGCQHGEIIGYHQYTLVPHVILGEGQSCYHHMFDGRKYTHTLPLKNTQLVKLKSECKYVGIILHLSWYQIDCVSQCTQPMCLKHIILNETLGIVVLHVLCEFIPFAYQLMFCT